MPVSARTFGLCVISLVALSQTACNLVPQYALRDSQLRAYQLNQQNRALAVERNRLAQRNGSLQAQLSTADQRLANLKSERSKLQQRYAGLLDRAGKTPSPLSRDASRRFEELAKKYPQFEFDPQTGVSKFHSDILFNSGSAEIKRSAIPLLRDFAKILNQGDAKRLNILVVGHTDDRRIAHSSTRRKHPTNWHLSTDRADSVVLALAKVGIGERRMGAAGYSKYQPIVPNKDKKSRQKNRRVEIFVLAPDAAVAGWDPGHSRN